MTGRARGAIAVLAPAKVNLTLHVTGQRADGYHLLDSLVVFVGVYDRLTLAPGEGLSLEVGGPHGGLLGPAAGGDNIILRAARALAEATGCTAGAHITLHKVLPVAAGVGGGSADAAAALLGLCRLWGVSLPEPEMLALAGRLGADVPVCLRGRATTVGGVGEHLSDAPPLPAAWLVLVNPGVPLSTPAVFKARSGPFSAPAPLVGVISDAAALAAALAERRNDLTAAALSLAPEVGVVLAALSGVPGCLLARMSGSGATCWGLFPTEAEAQAAARTLRAGHAGWWSAAAPLLGKINPFATPH